MSRYEKKVQIKSENNQAIWKNVYNNNQKEVLMEIATTHQIDNIEILNVIKHRYGDVEKAVTFIKQKYIPTNTEGYRGQGEFEHENKTQSVGRKRRKSH